MFTMMLMTDLDLGYSVYRLLGPPVSSSSSLFPVCPRLMNCHGVAGLPFRSTHRFAPQAQSSMSSRHGEAPGHSRFSKASCWWPPPVPFVCMADFFARSGGLVSPGRRAGKARVFSQGAGDGAVRLCGAGWPDVTGVMCWVKVAAQPFSWAGLAARLQEGQPAPGPGPSGRPPPPERRVLYPCGAPWRLVPYAEKLDSGVPEFPGVLRRVCRARGEPPAVAGDDVPKGLLSDRAASIVRWNWGRPSGPEPYSSSSYSRTMVMPRVSANRRMDSAWWPAVRVSPVNTQDVGSCPVMVHPAAPTGVVCRRSWSFHVAGYPPGSGDGDFQPVGQHPAVPGADGPVGGAVRGDGQDDLQVALRVGPDLDLPPGVAGGLQPAHAGDLASGHRERVVQKGLVAEVLLGLLAEAQLEGEYGAPVMGLGGAQESGGQRRTCRSYGLRCGAGQRLFVARIVGEGYPHADGFSQVGLCDCVGGIGGSGDFRVAGQPLIVEDGIGKAVGVADAGRDCGQRLAHRRRTANGRPALRSRILGRPGDGELQAAGQHPAVIGADGPVGAAVRGDGQHDGH